MDKDILRVWAELESYGRVQDVVGDIQKAGVLLGTIRRLIRKSQRDLNDNFGIFLDISEVHVDGMPGGRNRMKMEFWAKIKTTSQTDEMLGLDVEDTVANYVPSRVNWRSSPPKG